MSDKKIIRKWELFFQRCLGEGFSWEEMKARLLDKGYPEDQVDWLICDYTRRQVKRQENKRKILIASAVAIMVLLFVSLFTIQEMTEDELTITGMIVRNPVQPDSSCVDTCLSGISSLWDQVNMRNPWQKNAALSGGEGMQMVWDIDWNPTDVNILYLVTDTTKVWKSADGGDTWEPTGTNDVAPKGGSSIVSDPTNADVVIYSASKMYDSVYSGTLEGFYLSMDGGDSWSQVGGNRNFSRTKHGKTFLFDELSYAGGRSMKIFAGSMQGLFESTDGGLNWNLANAMNGEEVYDLEWAGAQHEIIFVSTNSNLYLFNTTTNSTTTLGGGLPGVPYDLVASNQNYSNVFVASTNGVYKSVDGGLNFTSMSSGLNTGVSYRHIAMSRVNESRIFVSPNGLGGNNPYYTANGGASWVRAVDVNDEQFLDGGYYYPEPIAFNPGDQLIAITQRDSALAKTSDGGASWEYSGNGFTGARLNGIAFVNETSMIFCLTDYGLYRSDDGGQSFYDLNETGTGSDRSCGGVAFNGSRIIATYGSWTSQDIITSDNNGASWTTRLDASVPFDYVAFNPDNSSIAYADGYYSLDSGQTWNTVGNSYKIKVIDPRNSSVIYGWKDLGASVSIGKSTDNGVSWTQIGGDISITDVKGMDVDPFSSSLHMIVAQYAIYQYFESGSWSSGGTSGLLATSSENYQTVRFDPFINNTVWTALQGYKYHGRGLFLSLDGGQTWSNELKNLGDYNDIYNIEIDPYDSEVYITGPGVWSTSLTTLCSACFTIINTSNASNASSNNAPTHSTPILNASDAPYNTTDAVLSCYNQSTADADNDSVTNSYKWFRNAAVVSGMTMSEVAAENTSAGEIWICEVIPYDGTDYGVAINSSALTINELPDTSKVKINSTTLNNYTDEDLACYANVTGFMTGMTVYYKIYNGSALHSSGSRYVMSAALENVANVSSASTAANQTWNCSVLASYDGMINESAWNIASITIRQAPYCGDESCNGLENCSSCSADCGACPVENEVTLNITPCILEDKSWNEDSYLADAYNLSDCFDDQLNHTLNYSVIGNDSIRILIVDAMVNLSAPADWNGVEHAVFNAMDSGNASRFVSANNVTLTVNAVADCGDAVCDSGESCSSCSADCGACPVSLGGGAGGGGGGAAPARSANVTNVTNASKIMNASSGAVNISYNNSISTETQKEPVYEQPANILGGTNASQEKVIERAATAVPTHDSSAQKSIVSFGSNLSGTLYKHRYLYSVSLIIFVLLSLMVVKGSKKLFKHPDVSKYIIDALQYGYSFDAIRAVLKKRNMADSAIDGYFHELRMKGHAPLIRHKRPVSMKLSEASHDKLFDELYLFSKKQRKVGYDLDDIRKMLLGYGYPKAVVEDVFKVLKRL